MQPAGQKVALEIIKNLDRFAEDIKKRSGLLISNSVTQGTPISGRVYKISPNIVDPQYKIGEVVVFRMPEGEVFKGWRLDDKELVFVEHDWIIATITEEDTNA